MNANDLRNTQNMMGNTETITFKSKLPGSPATFNSYTLTRCRVRRLNKQEQLAAGLLAVKSRVIDIPKFALENATAIGGAPLPAATPKISDQLVRSDGAQYVIDDIDSVLMDMMFGCRSSLIPRPG